MFPLIMAVDNFALTNLFIETEVLYISFLLPVLNCFMGACVRVRATVL